MVESNVMKEIEDEIKRAKGSSDDFEIEVVEDPVQEASEEAKDVAEEKQQQQTEQEDDYGPKVQKRIQKLVVKGVKFLLLNDDEITSILPEGVEVAAYVG